AVSISAKWLTNSLAISLRLHSFRPSSDPCCPALGCWRYRQVFYLRFPTVFSRPSIFFLVPVDRVESAVPSCSTVSMGRGSFFHPSCKRVPPVKGGGICFRIGEIICLGCEWGSVVWICARRRLRNVKSLKGGRGAGN